jgi:integrase
MPMPEQRYTLKPTILTSKSGRNVSKLTGEAVVYIRVTTFQHGERPKTKYNRTRITVKPKDFDKKEGKVKRSDPKSSDKNYQIFSHRYDIEQEIKQVKDGTGSSTMNPHYLPQPSKTLLDYIDDYIRYRKSAKAPYGTLKEFKTLKTRLEKYQDFAHRKLYINDVCTMRFSDDFHVFLTEQKSTKNPIEQAYADGTIEKTYTILRTVLNFYYRRREEYGLKMGDTYQTPDWKKGTKSVNEPNPLSETELITLIEHKFKTESLNQHKDRFLFQCSTGCRFSDMFRITKSNIIDGCIEYFPQKTVHKKDNKVIVPLNKLSSSILRKYRFDMNKLKISNQKYNAGLAEMVTAIKKTHTKLFTQSFTSHNGRDTFITIAINSDVDVPSLLKMVGQSSWAIMQRYYKVDRERIIEKMKKVKVFQF